MKELLYSLLATALLSSCGNSEPQEMEAIVSEESAKVNKMDQVSWVLGTWENTSAQGTFTEYWEKTSETVYSGTGIGVTPKGDTMFAEHIKLELVNDTLYYKPVVGGQNEGKETVFTEKSLSDSGFVFENPEHDFPQRIVYRKPTDSTLYARIEGKENGKDRQEEFQFRKKTPSTR
jgi:hypothetical protein